MMRPPMAAMGPLSRWQSSGGLPRHCETGATDRTLGKSILNQIPTSAAAPRLCDVPPTATIPSLRIFEHVAESGEALGERYERLHRGLVQAFDAGRLRCGLGPRRKAQCFHCRLDYAVLFRSPAARFEHQSATFVLSAAHAAAHSAHDVKSVSLRSRRTSSKRLELGESPD